MKGRRIVALEQVPEDQRQLTQRCLYCCHRHGREPRKAVAAVEVTEAWMLKGFYGICGYHAEVYPFTEEDAKKRPMICPYCFPERIR